MFIGLASVIYLAAVLVPLFALVDLLRTPSAAWAASGQNQIVWTLVILFAGSLFGAPVQLLFGADSQMLWVAPVLIGNVIGAIAYLTVARPQLAAARVSA